MASAFTHWTSPLHLLSARQVVLSKRNFQEQYRNTYTHIHTPTHTHTPCTHTYMYIYTFTNSVTSSVHWALWQALGCVNECGPAVDSINSFIHPSIHFCGCGNQIQDLVHARQELSHWTIPAITLLCIWTLNSFFSSSPPCQFFLSHVWFPVTQGWSSSSENPSLPSPDHTELALSCILQLHSQLLSGLCATLSCILPSDTSAQVWGVVEATCSKDDFFFPPFPSEV